jgi:hypothetical protein
VPPSSEPSKTPSNALDSWGCSPTSVSEMEISTGEGFFYWIGELKSIAELRSPHPTDRIPPLIRRSPLDTLNPPATILISSLYDPIASLCAREEP